MQTLLRKTPVLFSIIYWLY